MKILRNGKIINQNASPKLCAIYESRGGYTFEDDTVIKSVGRPKKKIEPEVELKVEEIIEEI